MVGRRDIPVDRNVGGYMEYYVEIDGATYGMDDIKSVVIEQPLFDKLSVGNACSAQLTIEFWQFTYISRMAKIVPYARLQSTDNWIKQSEFYIDTRSLTDGLMTIVAYDSMLKAEVEYTPPDDFKGSMRETAEDIASLMGLELDPRTVINSNYTISFPANNYTMREILKHIAAAHGGNWIITAENKLLLIPLFASMPPETNYLIEENGKAILFGGVRILV